MEKLQTKLFEAATQNSIPSLQNLLNQDPLLLDRALLNPNFNETPLHVAAMLGHLEFVQEIIRLKPELVNELNSHLSSPLHLAAAKGHVGVVRALLSVDKRACLLGDRNELLPLHLAAAKGRVDAMEVLLEAQPDAAMVKAYGGESILHFCVKSYQFEALRLIVESVRSDELIKSRDNDGNTVLHLAVANKQVETIKFLLSMDGLDPNPLNHEGLTPLDLLIQSKRDIRDSQIQTSLTTAGATAASLNLKMNPKKYNRQTSLFNNNNNWEISANQHDDIWLDKKRSALMVVASLIATMAFQIGVNPPGGVWQDDAPSHRAGDSVYVTRDPRAFLCFYGVNTTAFVAALSIILLLTSGLPMRRRFFVWVLMVVTWIAITAIALCYVAVVIMLTPEGGGGVVVVEAIRYTVVAWVVLVGVLLVGHTVRMVVRVRRAWARRSGGGLAGPGGL